MVERLVFAVVIIVLGVGLYRLVIYWQSRRASTTLPTLTGRESGKYLILYFTSPTCVPCRTTQRPALNTVQEVFGEQVQILTIDVTEQPDAADRWGVMSLPSTFVFNTKDMLVAYNIGVTYADKLIQQLAGIGAQKITS